MKHEPRHVLFKFLESVKQYRLRGESNEKSVPCFKTIRKRSQIKGAWIWQLVKFSYEFDTDIVKLVDNNLFLQNSATTDEAAVVFLKDLVEEIKRYNKGVIIFDLDSISGIKKVYSSI